MYQAARSEEMRVVLKRGSDGLGINRYVQDLHESVTLVDEDGVCLTRSIYWRQRYARLSRVADLPEPEFVARSRTNFSSLIGFRVVDLNLSVEEERASLWPGSRFKAA